MLKSNNSGQLRNRNDKKVYLCDSSQLPVTSAVLQTATP